MKDQINIGRSFQLISADHPQIHLRQVQTSCFRFFLSLNQLLQLNLGAVPLSSVILQAHCPMPIMLIFTHNMHRCIPLALPTIFTYCQQLINIRSNAIIFSLIPLFIPIFYRMFFVLGPTSVRCVEISPFEDW